jgi:hypothetical protein
MIFLLIVKVSIGCSFKKILAESAAGIFDLGQAGEYFFETLPAGC